MVKVLNLFRLCARDSIGLSRYPIGTFFLPIGAGIKAVCWQESDLGGIARHKSRRPMIVIGGWCGFVLRSDSMCLGCFVMTRAGLSNALRVCSPTAS